MFKNHSIFPDTRHDTSKLIPDLHKHTKKHQQYNTNAQHYLEHISNTTQTTK